MTSYVYNATMYTLCTGGLDLSGGTYKVTLHTSAYTPDVDAHEFYSDLTGEVTGSGYSAGGLTLSNFALTQVNASNRIEFTADDAIWQSVSVSFRHAILRKDTGDDATSPLLVCFDFDATLEASGMDLVLQWDADGGLFVVRQGA